MTVMLPRGPLTTSNPKDRKRPMAPPPTSPPLKKVKAAVEGRSEEAREVQGGRVSQGCQTALPALRCQHGEEEEEVAPIGTPVSLPATVWYEDKDGELLTLPLLTQGRRSSSSSTPPPPPPRPPPPPPLLPPSPGLLVVNVTWRGRTYVGTLMDSTKSEHIAEQSGGRTR